ncbi:hypothetical protein ES703_50340 [subsurface metagenome]
MQQTQQQQQQNGARRVIPCYDELIAFLKGWFAKTAPTFEKPILEINRYAGLLAKWQEVVKWTVTDTARGELKEISMICDNYAPLTVRIQIGAKRLDSVQLQTALTLPFGDLKLLSGIAVVVWCKSDGVTAINFDASIVGKEVFKA